MNLLSKIINPKSLFFRLFLALWLLSGGMLFLTGIYINRTVDHEFEDFVRATHKEERENLLNTISEIVEESEHTRQPRDQMAINHISRTHNERIIIKSVDGDVIHDSAKHGPGPHMGGGHMRDSVSNEKSLSEIPSNILDENTYPLTINGTDAGSVIFLSADRNVDFFTPIELNFKNQVKSSIFFGGMISLILAAIISSVISHSISKPVYNLKKTAEGLKEGNLDLRAPVKGPREIRQLSMSFNSMAENLEKTDYLKKKLTQDVSHELRNPVSSVKGYLEAFIDGVLPTNEENINHTIEELERLENLTEELHQLALVDFKETKPTREQINLNKIAEKIKYGVEPLIAKKELSFVYKPLDEKLYILGDEDLLFRAIKNLIQNAINYTNSNDTIEFGISKSGKEALIYVSDTGKGIPKGKLPYIFERFYRVDESRAKIEINNNKNKREKSSGSGLGLSLVNEWVRTMGGKIKVESKEGKGSTFWLIFPLFHKN